MHPLESKLNRLPDFTWGSVRFQVKPESRVHVTDGCNTLILFPDELDALVEWWRGSVDGPR